MSAGARWNFLRAKILRSTSHSLSCLSSTVQCLTLAYMLCSYVNAGRICPTRQLTGCQKRKRSASGSASLWGRLCTMPKTTGRRRSCTIGSRGGDCTPVPSISVTSTVVARRVAVPGAPSMSRQLTSGLSTPRPFACTQRRSSLKGPGAPLADSHLGKTLRWQGHVVDKGGLVFQKKTRSRSRHRRSGALVIYQYGRGIDPSRHRRLGRLDGSPSGLNDTREPVR